MSSYVRLVYDRIDFLEFKQNILFLKQPQHKASVFYELTLEDFLKIRDFTSSIEEKISIGEKYTINDYEKELFKIWAPIKSYPSSSTLVAKVLMSEDNFNSLFKYLN
ncbi:hypothetical protein [Romboutsia sp.]|uniref:hypothetical protein n=1 Tax=Romboutsia sp. TaxID=1965302 RepID=UPI002CDAEFB8|nr:hypothetical protein [Romboutsia sp.]HSQ90373.1 hypothetical protein [Romboutsia sp.]